MSIDPSDTALEPANDLQADMGNPDGEVFEDYEPPAPSAYHLGSNEGRCGFLEAYIWRGEEELRRAAASGAVILKGPWIHEVEL